MSETSRNDPERNDAEGRASQDDPEELESQNGGGGLADEAGAGEETGLAEG